METAGDILALVADGDPALRRVLKRLLERAGCRVCLAADGEQALAEMRRRPPALAFLDLEMPTRGGLETIAEARRERALDATRLVLVASHHLSPRWEEAARRGADAMVSKPFCPADLLGRIQEWTQTVRAGAAGGDAAVSPERASDPEV